MSETAFLLGLLASATLMFVGMALWLRRPRPPAPGPLVVHLGPVLSGRALGATLAAFVAGFALLGLLAVAAHHLVGHDGPLYVAFGLPWIIPPMFSAARWGQVTGAQGALTLDADAITLTWGAATHVVPRAVARPVERVVGHGPHGAWVLEVQGDPGSLVVAWPVQGVWGERFRTRLRAVGVQDAPDVPPAAAPLLADLHEVRALRDRLGLPPESP